MAQNQNAGVLFDRKHVPDLTTASDAYVNVPLDSSGNTIWNTEKLLSKIFYFNATINNLLVRVLASDDGGETFPIIAYPETLVAVGSPVRATIGNYYGQMKIQVKPAASGQNGTLTTEAYGISVADLTDVEITADTAGLATSALQTALNERVGEVQAAAADIKAAVVAAVGVSTGTKTCATSAGRLKAATLENVVSLTVKVRSLGDASYVGVGNASGQDFRLTAIDDSIELDIDPYAVYVIDDHTSTAAVVEYIARLSA